MFTEGEKIWKNLSMDKIINLESTPNICQNDITRKG